MTESSFIYTGKVIHKRFKPKTHYFNYKVFSLLLDLSEINLLERELKLFSYNNHCMSLHCESSVCCSCCV